MYQCIGEVVLGQCLMIDCVVEFVVDFVEGGDFGDFVVDQLVVGDDVVVLVEY